MDYEVVERRVDSYEELHSLYPNKEVLAYDLDDLTSIFDGGIVYAVGDVDTCYKAFEQFRRDHPNSIYTYIITSPVDLRTGLPMFCDDFERVVNNELYQSKTC